jgi:hypothetical protein
MGIGLLIFKRMNTYGMARLADEITRMRLHLRSRHKDIRANTNLYKDIYSYIETVPAGKKPGEVSAREEFNGAESDDEVQQARIRKRLRDEDRDETYYDAAAARGEESAVTGALRSKKQKKAKPPKTKSPTKDRAVPVKRSPPPTQAIPSHPPPAYAPRQTAPQPAPPPAQAPIRPPPIGMDAPYRGPAYVPAPTNRSPPQPQNRSPPQPQYSVHTYRNQVFNNPGHGYQQPPYGRR